MSEDSLPVPQLTLNEGQGEGRDAALGSGTRRHSPASVHVTPTTVVIAVAALGYAAMAGSFRRLTIPAELATLVPGALICRYAVRRNVRRYPAPDHVDGRGSLAWGAVLVLFAIWELYADLSGSTPAHPTLSILMGPMLQHPENRAMGYVLWLAAGAWVVRR
jgi:hypothetical protein